MKTKIKRFYSFHLSYYNEKEIIIYRQKQEDKNSYSCVSHIVEQLLKDNKKYSFHILV